MPRVVAQDNDLRRGRTLVILVDHSAEKWSDARDVEQSTDARRPHELLRLAVTGQRSADSGISGDVHRWSARFPVIQVGGRRRVERVRRTILPVFVESD